MNKNTKKIIGITPRIIIEENVEKQFVNTRYISFLDKLGFNYLMLNLDNPNLNDILDLCDGFLITGGDDIDPKLYNEENTASINIHPRMDETDMKVIDYAVKNKKLLLGICRGFQIINTYFSGSLYQDIPNHQKTRHIINVFDNKYSTQKSFETNSYHHQAAKVLGKDLVVIAHSTDNIVEAFYHKTLPIIATQWHPEIEYSEFELEIFRSFIKNL